MKRDKLKKAMCALSMAVALGVGGGVVSSVANTGVVAQALTEAQLRQKVLARFPGTVIKVKKDWDDGQMEYDYKIRQNNGVVVSVEITANGWIKDVDYEGKFVNGMFYEWD